MFFSDEIDRHLWILNKLNYTLKIIDDSTYILLVGSMCSFKMLFILFCIFENIKSFN